MSSNLNRRVSALAQQLVERESKHAEARARAKSKADDLHGQIASAIDEFNSIVTSSAPQLRVAVSEPRTDDKHLHAVEFDLERGRHRAIVTIKSKGEVTLVGPFREGKNEGPCRSFSFEADSELDDAMGDFLESFLEEASAP